MIWSVPFAWSMLSGMVDERIDFYSLQRGPASEQAKTPPAGMRMIDWAGEFENFADTAAFIMNLDLVIAVDTSAGPSGGSAGKNNMGVDAGGAGLALAAESGGFTVVSDNAVVPADETARLDAAFRQPWQRNSNHG